MTYCTYTGHGEGFKRSKNTETANCLNMSSILWREETQRAQSHRITLIWLIHCTKVREKKSFSFSSTYEQGWLENENHIKKQTYIEYQSKVSVSKILIGTVHGCNLMRKKDNPQLGPYKASTSQQGGKKPLKQHQLISQKQMYSDFWIQTIGVDLKSIWLQFLIELKCAFLP